MLTSLFQYKAWANAGLLAAVAGIDGERFPDELRKAIRILNHTHVVDRIFAAHLTGTTHAHAATNTEETPGLAALAEGVRRSDAWYVGYVRDLETGSIDERIRFRFTDGQAGEMSRGEMLHHLIAHGAYHRGAVGAILKSLSIKPPADTFTAYLHATQPQRREAAASQGNGNAA
ncbi:MAG: DinB family protein [Pseudoxanthomonas sp.]